MLTFVYGFLFASVLIVSMSCAWDSRIVKRGFLAQARYDEKKKEWRVACKFISVFKEIDDIRSGRKPGAIKYVD
uniref:Uncharacterized protein n=1 Tax=Escherichia phage ETEP102 TaxID=3117680 RepID=A0AAU6PXJ1_9CAUD